MLAVIHILNMTKEPKVNKSQCLGRFVGVLLFLLFIFLIFGAKAF